MKRISVIVFLMFAAAIAFSQSATTIGASYWRATPEFKAGYFKYVEGNDGNMFGPYLNFRTGKLVLGGSLYTGNFEMSQDWGYYEMEFTLKRTDINVTAGYSFSNALTVFGAMKNLSCKMTDFKAGGQDMDITDSEYSGNLFGGGLSGVVPLGQSSFFLFGSAAYLVGTLKFDFGEDEDYYYYYGYSYDDYYDETEEVEFDVNLTSVTLGAGYRLSPKLNLLVGFRVDSMVGEDDDENELEENYKGINVSLGYTIR